MHFCLFSLVLCSTLDVLCNNQGVFAFDLIGWNVFKEIIGASLPFDPLIGLLFTVLIVGELEHERKY